MKVCISVKGRFHAFDLARELQHLNALGRLITSYPGWMPERFGVESTLVRSLVVHEVLDRLWTKVPDVLRQSVQRSIPIAEAMHKFFDRRAARIIPEDTDVFVGWSSFSLESIRRAKRLGARTIVERGSSHVRYQESILKDEYGRWGMSFPAKSADAVEQEEAEYAEADFIAVPSTFVRQSFRMQGVQEQKMIQVAYGVDHEMFTPERKRDATFRIVHCGALSIRKGVHYLLQAFSELALPNSELWLVGTMLDEIRPFLARYSGPNVHHLGPFPQEQLPKYYAAGSLLCLASVEDGFGMVLTQAMACGLPVVCTTNTAGADIVQEGVEGFVVPIRSVDAIKEKLALLHGDQELAAQMGAAARKRVISQLTWGHYGKNIKQAYEAMIQAQL